MFESFSKAILWGIGCLLVLAIIMSFKDAVSDWLTNLLTSGMESYIDSLVGSF